MMDVITIARVCHEANRAICEVQGDFSVPPWGKAPDWQRKSAIDGVQAILLGDVRSAEESHINWCAHKASEGWSWGPVKDPERKLHPCLRPFSELPPAQRVKDWLFYGIVRSLAAGLGKELAH